LKERHVDLCRVLISQETLVHLKGRFVMESWGPMALRGKQQLVEVYRVVGHAAPALRLEAASAKTTAKNTAKASEKASEKPR
jgi:class 3 adenylate cyclase